MNAPTESPTKRTRAVDVQVPGAAPVAQEQPRDEAKTIDSPLVDLLANQDIVDEPVASKPGRGGYRTMRAADIDHTKLTAPVMTLDGWLCPPAPEKKA